MFEAIEKTEMRAKNYKNTSTKKHTKWALCDFTWITHRKLSQTEMKLKGSPLCCDKKSASKVKQEMFFRNQNTPGTENK